MEVWEIIITLNDGGESRDVPREAYPEIPNHSFEPR